MLLDVGVPLIVIVFDDHAAVTPGGNPVGVPMPVAPVVVLVIGVNAVLIHRVGLEDGRPTDCIGCVGLHSQLPVLPDRTKLTNVPSLFDELRLSLIHI